MKQGTKGGRLAQALTAYYLKKPGCSREEAYHRLCRLEQYLLDVDGGPWMPFAARTRVCRALLGKTPIYELYPEEDLRGAFEGDYDEQKLREQKRFGTPDWDGSIRMDPWDSAYRAYQSQLQEQVISAICRAYPEEVFSQLSEEEKKQVRELALPTLKSPERGPAFSRAAPAQEQKDEKRKEEAVCQR